MEDREIIDLYWARDEQAIAETQEKYGLPLTRMASRMIYEEEAKECVNDTYMAAWNQIPPTRPERFFAWLAKVCRNLIGHRIDWQNAARRKADLIPLLDELDACTGGANLTEEAIDEQETGRILSEFLHGIPYEKRVFFLRRYWFGDTIAEIAERFGCSESKVKVTLHRTRNQLKQVLEQEGVRI